MFAEFVAELSVGGAVNFDTFARAAERDELLIGAEVGGEHGVNFIADGGEALAGRHVEEHDTA